MWWKTEASTQVVFGVDDVWDWLYVVLSCTSVELKSKFICLGEKDMSCVLVISI